MSDNKWFQKSRRRNLVDMHIHGWNPRFLAQLDPVDYVAHLRASNTKSALIYAQSHVGYCNWPTSTGVVHPALASGDFIGDVVAECRRHGMDVILYYSLIFNTIEADRHPSWRQVDLAGKQIFGLRNPRYGTCCPNNDDYREFTREQIVELTSGYQIDGIWFDMTFWPDVCGCPACRARYQSEIGGEMPAEVRWRDTAWVTFQRARERWMAEFGHFATDIARATRPGITVAHQSGMFLADWKLCGSVELASASDYMSADLYGDVVRHSISSKVFYNLSENLPFEYMTSRCPDLRFHTTTKSEPMLREQALSAVANGGGFLFIDAIDPEGTLDAQVYDRMRPAFDTIERLEPHLGGYLRQDVAIYLSMESRVPVDAVPVPTAGGDTAFTFDAIYGGGAPPHVVGLGEYAGHLVRSHIPFGVITRRNLDALNQHKVLILAETAYMSDEEIVAIRAFVYGGGILVASGEVATMTLAGETTPHGRLSDVLGCRLNGRTKQTVTYMRPSSGYESLFAPYGARNPINVMGPQMVCHVDVSDAEVIGRLTLPYSDPTDSVRFAAIHSNPPGEHTDAAAIVMHPYGGGSAIYIAATPEFEFYGHLLARLLLRAGYDSPTVFSDAPACVEVTVFDDRANGRVLVHLLNYQETLPPIPIHDFTVSVSHSLGEAVALHELTGKSAGTLRSDGDRAHITIDSLNTYALFELHVEGR